MRFGVVVFPGSNCEQDVVHAAEMLGLSAGYVWHGDTDLSGYDAVVLPGGFSYGDYIRCGAVARFSPVMAEVVRFAERGGPVMGICNGFQILCEAHLLPGALLHNTSHQFICRNAFIRTETTNSLITSETAKGQVLMIPIAHGEGRFFASEETLKQLNDNDQVLFRYCDGDGHVTDASNPNGSLQNIAGICNEGRNVFGMMPHPERASDPELSNTDGRILFEAILNTLAKV